MRSVFGGLLSIAILSLISYSVAQFSFQQSAASAYSTKSVRLSPGH